MNFLKRNCNAIVVCILEALIGVLLLINPISFTSGIIIACGIALLLLGIMDVIRYFRTDPVEASLRRALVKGLVMLLLGACLAFRPKWLIAVFPILTILYGIVILVGGLYKVQWFVDALRIKTGRWFVHAINAAVSILCACVILANPFTSTVALWMFIGISLIVEAVLDVFAMCFARSSSED